MNQSEIIGNRVKEERLKRKLTLKQLSEQVGLSIGYLSQVERGYGTLSLNALKNLSSVLGIEMSAFFDSPPEETPGYITHGYQREQLQVSRQFIQYSVTPPLAGTEMRASVFEVSPTLPGEEEPVYSHPEEEILYVLEGCCTLTISDAEYLLTPGSCAHIPPNVPHAWKNPSPHIAKLIGVYL